MSAEQREALDAILRQSASPFDSDVGELRRLTREYASAQPLPAGVPHVFQSAYPILDEAAAALDRAGQFLSAQLASAERVSERSPA